MNPGWAAGLGVQPGAAVLQKSHEGSEGGQVRGAALVPPREAVHQGERARGRRRREGATARALGVARSPQFLAEIEGMLELADVKQRDPDRPRFHVMPRGGWMNDPNGPIYYKGRYHLFYQHVTDGCEWNWGIVWGHAISKDLVHWEHLEAAIEPTPGGFDADGCFSGCCIADTQNDGLPTILFTGVRLRSNTEAGPLPPVEHDLQLPFIETQGVATAVPGDDKLRRWNKMEAPLIPLPPSNMPLTGWRDPYIFQSGGNGKDWIMLMGSGIKGEGGAVLVYTSKTLSQEWQFKGLLCLGDADTGAMWECPLLLKLEPYKEPSARLPMHTLGLQESDPSSGSWTHAGESEPKMGLDGGVAVQEMAYRQDDIAKVKATADVDERYQHLLCISPDAPTNPVICYMGEYKDLQFNLNDAKGPFRLDMGDILYAPNISKDAEGRSLMWGWLQERRKVNAYDYSGCLSVPRILSIKGDKLMQEPAEEISALRHGASWHESKVTLHPEEATPLPGISGEAVDLEVTFERGSSDAAGILLRSWHVGGEGSAAIIYDWERSSLEVVFEAVDPETMEFSLDDEASRRVGGNIDLAPGEPLKLRVLMDHSCIEIFTSTGDVLSTRVYRGLAPPGAGSGVDFVSFGGSANMTQVAAHEMSTIWKTEAVAKDEAEKLLEKTIHPMFASLTV